MARPLTSWSSFGSGALAGLLAALVLLALPTALDHAVETVWRPTRDIDRWQPGAASWDTVGELTWPRLAPIVRSIGAEAVIVAGADDTSDGHPLERWQAGRRRGQPLEDGPITDAHAILTPLDAGELLLLEPGTPLDSVARGFRLDPWHAHALPIAAPPSSLRGALTLADGQVMALLADATRSYAPALQRFDPRGGRWAPAIALPETMAGDWTLHRLAPERLLLAPRYLEDARPYRLWLYDPANGATRQVTELDAMLRQRAGPGSTPIEILPPLGDGQLALVASFGALAWQPSSGAVEWLDWPPLPHAPIRLADGHLLGMEANGAQAWLLDAPANGATKRAAPPLPRPRESFTLVALSDGSALAIGGLVLVRRPTRSAAASALLLLAALVTLLLAWRALGSGAANLRSRLLFFGGLATMAALVALAVSALGAFHIALG